jgi:hypothetical protein
MDLKEKGCKINGTGSGPCQMAGFDITGIGFYGRIVSWSKLGKYFFPSFW